MKSLSHAQLFATPWTVACQVPPSMGLSRQEYWSGLPFPSPFLTSGPGLFPAHLTRQAGVWGGSVGLRNIQKVEGVRNIRGFVSSCQEGESPPPRHHKMAPCPPQARWSVYGCQLNCVIALFPKGLSKWNCCNFNLPYKASESKERKGTRGSYVLYT